jgi:hypothetical protein
MKDLIGINSCRCARLCCARVSYQRSAQWCSGDSDAVVTDQWWQCDSGGGGDVLTIFEPISLIVLLANGPLYYFSHANSEETFEFERMTQWRENSRGNFEFCLKWKGCSRRQNSWINKSCVDSETYQWLVEEKDLRVVCVLRWFQAARLSLILCTSEHSRQHQYETVRTQSQT